MAAKRKELNIIHTCNQCAVLLFLCQDPQLSEGEVMWEVEKRIVMRQVFIIVRIGWREY